MLEDWSPPRAAGQVMLLREPPPSRAWRPYGSVYNIAGTGEVEVTDRLLARAAAEGADGLLFQAGSAGPTTYSSTTAGGSYAANTRIGTIGLSNESTTTTAVTSYAALGQPITMRDPGSEAWIGAGCRSYVPGAADGAPASNSQASYVAEVVPQSPAAVAGLRVGDVVLGVAHDGRPTWALPCPALAAALAKAVGTRVELAVWRPSTDPAALLTVQVPPGHAGPLGIGATTFEAAEAQSVG
jgi:membrane-associated protease RseP (regulator of RpoE activity)